MDTAQLAADLRIDEGNRLTAYKDTRGIITIGVGRNLQSTGLSQGEVNLLLQNDIVRVCNELDASCPWWRDLAANPQRVLANLCFNMGMEKLLTFNTFLDLMKSGSIIAAAADLANTAWYDEVGDRGPRMVARLLGK